MPSLLIGPEKVVPYFRALGVRLDPVSGSPAAPPSSLPSGGGFGGGLVSASQAVAGAASLLGEAGAAGGGSSLPGSSGSRVAVPASPLFVPASQSQADLAELVKMDTLYRTFIAQACQAIQAGFDQWRFTAFFSDVIINAVAASGGSLNGPPLGPFISGLMPKTGVLAPLGTAIAVGLGDSWDTFIRSVSVPGLPWYPMFAAWPGPTAPPMDNSPTPFMTLTQNPTPLNAASLQVRMTRAVKGNFKRVHEVMSSFAKGLDFAFMTWRYSQMVALVKGFGPVPTFAPPYVPVGPVVGGSVISAPGCLIT